MSTNLPRTCFISHSYKDHVSCQHLLKILPREVTPFIFPPINAQPNQFVSNALLQSIRDHDGLIYLVGGYSATSFWVALERDYALRANKPVFAYNPQTHQLLRDTSPALRLPVFPSYANKDEEQVQRILTIMRQERFFDLWSPDTGTHNDFFEEMKTGIDQSLETGGYLLVFWSENAATSQYIKDDFDMAMAYVRGHINRASLDMGVLLACLDDTPIPDWLLTVQWGKGFGWDKGSMKPFIPLYSDYHRSQTHRIDDLIVNLYWLIYRNTRHDQWKF